MFTFSSLEQIIKQNGCDDIFIDEKEMAPDLAGKILVIKSKHLEQKVDAYLSIMRRIEDTETLLFIPQQLVSMIIGTKGRTINGIKRDIGCEIFVNQQLMGVALCSILVKSASPRTQAAACKSIFELLEKNASAEDISQPQTKPLFKTDIKTVAKFVISEDS